MPTRMDYTGMEAFIAIAQLGNFARAADHLNLSQAALSHRIRKLETEMGIQLLLRTTREVSLTAAGQELLPVAPRSFENLAMAYSAVQTRGQASVTSWPLLACQPWRISTCHLCWTVLPAPTPS
jgi:DNA-binding transcriptional LysR family regulator